MSTAAATYNFHSSPCTFVELKKTSVDLCNIVCCEGISRKYVYIFDGDAIVYVYS